MKPLRYSALLLLALLLASFVFLQQSGGGHEQYKAPILLAPAEGSEFVNSDIVLRWRYPPGLEGNQLYALRIWAENHSHQELWTADTEISVQRQIDSLSVAFGSYYWQVAVVNLDAAGVYVGMGSNWSAVGHLQRLRRPSIPATSYEELSAAARQFADMSADPSEQIDAVHRFVVQNSRDDFQASYAADYSDAVEMMMQYAQGDSSEMPQLLCDGRSTAMLTILRELGIESRLVFLYQSTPGWLSEHTVLEVFNPETQLWQVHDPAGGFVVVDVDTGQGASAERILFGTERGLSGCPISGGDCSLEVLAEVIGYFAALRYGHFSYEVWVNPDRFDISARFAGQGKQNLAEYIGHGDPRRVTLHLDNWAARDI